MSSAFGILVLVALVTCLPAVNSSWWNNWCSGWSEEEPANCPHVNNKTHVCSTLESSEDTCITIKCCSAFEDYEYYEDYDVDDYGDDYDNDDYSDENGGRGGRRRRGDHGGHRGGHDDGHSGRHDDGNSGRHDDGNSGRHDDGNSGGHDDGHSGGHDDGHSGEHDGCRLCFSARTCTVYKCFTSCCDGYQKDYTGTCSNSTGALECENGGTLKHNHRKGFFCKCPSGFRGTKCEIPKCRCKNGGECGVKDGQPHCNCTAGFHGDRCQNANCSMDCRNGGVCYKSDGNEYCLCPDNYIGKRCGQYYINPDACPPSVPTNDMCESQCTKNKHCTGDHVCCKEGCSSVCRPPRAKLCTYEGRHYTINATHRPDPCTNCTCMFSGDMRCYSISCAVPQCLYGDAETKPGDCCPSCSDNTDLPRIYNCSTQVVRLNTSSYTDIALLHEDSTKIQAYDADGNKLQVYYKPESVHHCHCAPSIGSETTVQAYATDVNDHLVTCSFRVIVADIYKPRFIYCPQNMHVSASDCVQWEDPTYEDNVGIKTILRPDRRSGEIFPVGKHTVAYHIWDHDSNNASCYFNVTVARDPPRMDNCPVEVLHLNTAYYYDYALLSTHTTRIKAYDYEGSQLKVQYQPITAVHCKCSNSETAPVDIQATATDDYNNTVTCSFQVIVKDIYRPRFYYCPDDIHASEGEVVEWKQPSYTDNVGIAGISSLERQSGEIFPVGTHNISYDIWDHDRNTEYCRFNIFVIKKEPAPPRIHNCEEPMTSFHFNTSYGTDHVVLDKRSTSMTAYDADGKELLVTYRPKTVSHCHCNESATKRIIAQAYAYDSNGKYDTCLFSVFVTDIYKPEFTYCPDNIYVSENDKVEWREPTYTDNVGIAGTSTSERHNGEGYPVGHHTVYYNIWDFDGNSASCRFNISVSKDKPIAPKITKCPTQVLHLNTSHNMNKTVLNEQATSIKAYDSDGNTLQVTYQPPSIHHCYCYDSQRTETTVTASAADGEGNVETCTFNITVRDIYSPIIKNCPRNLVVSEGEKAVWQEPTFEDNVGVAGSTALDRPNNMIFPIGNHTVSYEVWDYDGNTARCHFNVSVIKDVHPPPRINNCPKHVLTLEVSESTDHATVDESSTAIEADHSNGNKLQMSFVPQSVRHCHCSDPVSREIPVVASVTDEHGSSVTCSFKVIVTDKYKPVFSYCPHNIYASEGEIVEWPEPVYDDNVGVEITSMTGKLTGTSFPVGNHSVSYDVWDYDGNNAFCRFNVSVGKAKCTLLCYNGGSCDRSGSNQFCRCTANYIGRNCERTYTDPNTCPPPEPSPRGACKSDCTGNSQCVGGGVCCKEGCNSVCRQPETVYCALDGEQYAVNATYSPDACTNCICSSTGEMMCYSMSCSLPICPFGRQPVSEPGHCCLICPVKPKPLPIINCPSQPVRVSTGRYTNITLLDEGNTMVEAYDAYNIRLQVSYRPPVVHHCKCHEPSTTETVVEAYAADHHGNIVTCSFRVIVKDIFPPTLKSCPEDIYVFEDEVVEWFEPTFTDNVGVADTSCSSDQNGTVFPAGVHVIACDVWDYDRNTATCIFRVSVTADDTAIDDMSPGLRARYKTNKLHVILAPVGGATVLGALVLLLLFCCRRTLCASSSKTTLDQHKVNGQKQVNTKNNYADTENALHKKQRRSSNLSRSSSSSTHDVTSSSTHDVTSQALSFENNMYGLPRDMGIRPPAYTPYPHSPPAYSISGGSIKGVTYMSMPLPSYSNPDYETLGVHNWSKPSRSGRSGSPSRSGRSGSPSRSCRSGSTSRSVRSGSTSRSVGSGSTSRSVTSNTGSSTRASNSMYYSSCQ